MAHIDLKNNEPGIRGPLAYSPETARPMNELAEILLRNENNSLTKGERELIGAYISYLNDCFFCENVHGAMAAHYLQCDIAKIEAVKRDFMSADIPLKMKALLVIAGTVKRGGTFVTKEQIQDARETGASDKEIHDTVLIAAAFCMFNRYVDGLGTWAPGDPMFYVNRAPVLAEHGYIGSVGATVTD